ncbi:MAG: TonB-dependent receptor plug domain-containing protein [Thermoanaerobaculia bacterium]
MHHPLCYHPRPLRAHRILAFAILFIPLARLAAGDAPPVHRAEIEVAASRLSPEAAVGRSGFALTRDEIARLPVRDLHALLSYLAGGGLARRSAAGLQADAQLRGATFEQVAVFVDGVRVNDPQTGHFHLNIPLPLDAVDRVEVLLGPGSAVHGPDAFGGVIAITTRVPSALSARVLSGQNARRAAAISAPLTAGLWAAAEHDESDGFQPGTDFATTRGSAGWEREIRGWSLRSTLSREEREYGAFGYYSQRFPNQWEENGISLLTAEATRAFDAARLSIRAGAREHSDHFILVRENPAFYENRHRTRSAFAQATLSGADERLAWAAGVEGERSLLASARLGDRERSRGAAFGEASWRAGRILFSGALRADALTDLGTEISPGFGIEADLGGATFSLHRGRSFRQPSFTDLYYVSPGTVGNPDLAPEYAWTTEALLRAPVGGTLVDVSLFRRDGTDLIDYALEPDGTWRAMNHASARTEGLQISALFPAALGPVSGVRASLAWLDTELRADPSTSRYALSHPQFEGSVTGRIGLPSRVTADVALRHRAPITGPSYRLVDLRIARPLTRALALEVDIANLFDERYQELNGVPMPGRWVNAAIVWRSSGR